MSISTRISAVSHDQTTHGHTTHAHNQEQSRHTRLHSTHMHACRAMLPLQVGSHTSASRTHRHRHTRRRTVRFLTHHHLYPKTVHGVGPARGRGAYSTYSRWSCSTMLAISSTRSALVRPASTWMHSISPLAPAHKSAGGQPSDAPTEAPFSTSSAATSA